MARIDKLACKGCRAPDCPNKHRAKGYCVKHYNQMRWRRMKHKMQQLREFEARVPQPA